MNRNSLVRVGALSLCIIGMTIAGCLAFWMSLLGSQQDELISARHRNEVRVNQLNEAVTEQFDGTLRSIDVALEYLRVIYVKDPDNFDRSVQRVLKSFPQGMMRLILVFGADGYLAYSSDGPTPSLFFGDREHFRVHVESSEDRLFISKPVTGRIDNNFLIPISRAIRNGKQFLGVISIPLRPEYLAERFSALRVAPDDTLAIVRNDGNFIARNHRFAEALNTKLPRNRPFLVAQADQRGMFRDVSIVDKIPLLFSWHRLLNWPVSVVVAVNEETELRELVEHQGSERQRSQIGIATVLVFALAIGALLFRIGRRNQELQRSDERSRQILRSSPIPSALNDGQGNITYLNAAFVRTYGYTLEDIPTVADWWRKAYPEPAYRDHVAATWQKALENARANHVPFDSMEVSICCKNGQTRTVSVGAEALAGAFVETLLVTLYDLTTLRQLEAERERLALAVEQSPVAVIIANVDGNIEYVNAAFCLTSGYAREEVLGQNPRVLKSGYTTDEEYKSMWTEITAGRAWRGTFQNRRKDETVYWEYAQISPVFDRNGTITHFLGVKENITERKRADAERDRLLEIIAKAPDFIATADMQTHLKYLNAAGARLVGLPDDVDLVTLEIKDVHPEWATKRVLEEGIPAVLKRGFWQGETALLHRNGQEIPVSQVLLVHRDASGNPEYLSTIMRDLSERIRNESALRENEFMYRSLADGVSTLIWKSGPDKLCNYFNEPWLRFTGRTLEQEMGNGWAEGVHPDDMERCLNIYVTAFDRREPFSMDYRLRHADGTYHWLSDDGTPTYDSKGQFLGYVGACNDINARKAAQDDLAREEERIRTILESASDAIFVVDPDGYYRYVNGMAVRMLGYSREELLHMSIGDITPSEALDASLRGFQNLLTTGSYFGELVVKRKDGNKIDVEISGTMLPDGNAFGTCRDITERKRIDAELEKHRHHLETLVEARTNDLSIAKEAAEAANRAKNTFLATMSHELRTPLNAILGMTELAQRRATDPKQSEQLDKVKTASSNLLGIIKDILDISRIEANKLTLQEVDFSIAGVIADLHDIVSESATARHLGLFFDIPTNLSDRTFVGDPLRLGQVLLNLVANAIKFTPEGSVTLRAVLVDDGTDEVVMQFEVQDTGVGIAEKDTHRVFDAFEQADGSYTRKYGGTGLGLAISKRLVELMRGTIGVQSELGAGSTFWFLVRMRKSGIVAKPRSASGQHVSRDQLRSKHAGAYILIVDDDALNREIAQGLLEEAGLIAQLAADGTKAVQMAARINYDAILMDVQMPGLDGYEATAKVRQLNNNPHVPIIAFTANVFPEDESRCRDAGMNDFIGRPVHSEALFKTLLKWLDARTAEIVK